MRSELTKNFEKLQAKVEEIGYRGVWTTDYKAQKTKLSKEAGLLLPYTFNSLAEPISSLSFNSNIHRDDSEWFIEAQARSPGASGRRILESRVIDKDGDVRWIQSHGHWVIDRYGEVVFGSGIALDVTAFKAEGDSIQSSPFAPLAHPLNHLVDGLVTAGTAARELGFVEIERSVSKLLKLAARILAYRIIGKVH